MYVRIFLSIFPASSTLLLSVSFLGVYVGCDNALGEIVAWGDQKGVSESLTVGVTGSSELLKWMLGTKSPSSARAVYTLDYGASSPVFKIILLFALFGDF